MTLPLGEAAVPRTVCNDGLYLPRRERGPMSLQRRGSREQSRRKGSNSALGTPTKGQPSLLDLKTIYEGPGGPASKRLLHKTTLVITNRTVEIEREGVNVVLTVLTCGCWYVFFQTASIEIYELQRIQTLYLRDDVVHGEIMPEPGSSARGGEFAIDLPVIGDKTTKDLFFELKEAWQPTTFGSR